MEIHFFCFFSFLTLALVASRAAVTPEDYWNSVLPSTPMPKAISDLLQPEDLKDEKSTSVNVGKGGVNVDGGNGKPGGGKRSVSDCTVKITYRDAATENQLHDPNAALDFFLEKDLLPGTKMNLLFTKNSYEATFLPRQVAESIPFSSNKLPEILNTFSVKPRSVEADMTENTIKVCEKPGTTIGEEAYCATSLESMVDFITSKLGKNVQAISTVGGKETQMQKYTIVPGLKKMAGDRAVACHKQNYAYAIFYCHETGTTRAYLVPLVGDDGTKAKAVAVCHIDTSAWNPKHLALQVLKVKPGTVPVCHFLHEDQVVWTAN